MTKAILQLTLKSAAAFGRGDGVPGLVDNEVDRDQYGLPFLRGRALKGLLAESAENIIFAFSKQKVEKWRQPKESLFGLPGSGLEGRGILHVGNGCLPKNLRDLILFRMKDPGPGDLSPSEVFEALTGIRRQTAVNHLGAPERGSLRSLRVIIRGVVLEAPLIFNRSPTDDEWALLAGSVLGLRSGGLGRNRGRGRISAVLNDEATTRKFFEILATTE
ncbi:MAG: RAMP superfamily CRISPR-associated protein [Acidobacteriota bacterium]|jgi:hypothetical protein